MADRLQIGSIPVDVRRSARARRFTLRIQTGTGRASVTVPRLAPLSQVRRFLDEHRDWLTSRSAAQPEPVVPGPGTVLPFRGGRMTLQAGAGRRPRPIAPDMVEIPGSGAGFRGAALAWLKAEARAALVEAVDRHAARLGRDPRRITLRDPRTRWGSCSSEGGLMFSWRLILAPEDVLDYVAAHEVAHLRHMNHGRDFWAEVDRLKPDNGTWRSWLRTNGAALHRYRFET